MVIISIYAYIQHNAFENVLMSAGVSLADSTKVLERAAELFGILSAPVRLRIVSELCRGERNVTHLLTLIGTAQSNISQHLNILYRTGVVAKRREGVQIFYRIADESTALVCRTVCTQLAVGHWGKEPLLEVGQPTLSGEADTQKETV